jgi:hypothetical protein
MSLRRRLQRLEAQRAGRPCPACQSGRPFRFIMGQPGDPEPAPCPSCGREPFVFTIRIVPDRDDPAATV